MCHRRIGKPMLWKVTMAAAGLVAAFFAATLVLPLTTMGDPAYDIPMLRQRWYSGLFVFVPHLVAVLGGLALTIRARSPWPLAAALSSLAAFGMFFVEEGRFIRYGDLTMAHDLAMPLLWQSRAGCAALAALSAALFWRGHARA